jgi:hypothetical protein
MSEEQTREIEIEKKEVMYKEVENPYTERKALELLRRNFDNIKSILDDYMDMNEDDKTLVTLWVIGTWFHKDFLAYPYLYINAMRGSGKTRLEGIIKYLAWNGELLASLRESTLFRMAGKKTLILDEFEHISSKESLNLQELLNASYKKGMKVIRMRKVKLPTGEEQVMDEFEPYAPVVMANINGMDDVLGSRCINIILEKSDNPFFSCKAENFDENIQFFDIRQTFKTISCSSVVIFVKNIYTKWNNFINERHIYTNYTLYTNYTNYTNYTKTTEISDLKLDNLFLKLYESGIVGRDFELFLPLLLIANKLGEEYFNKMLEIAKKKVKEKKVEEATLNNDVLLYEFVSLQDGTYFKVNELTDLFKLWLGEKLYDKDSEINNRWMGRALKRLNLIVEKRRLAGGVEIKLDTLKAKEKGKMFNIK